MDIERYECRALTGSPRAMADLGVGYLLMEWFYGWVRKAMKTIGLFSPSLIYCIWVLVRIIQRACMPKKVFLFRPWHSWWCSSCNGVLMVPCTKYDKHIFLLLRNESNDCPADLMRETTSLMDSAGYEPFHQDGTALDLEKAPRRGQIPSRRRKVTFLTLSPIVAGGARPSFGSTGTLHRYFLGRRPPSASRGTDRKK